MKLIDLLILKCCTRIKDERTIYSIYHLFNGRASIQTLQDAHLYELTHLYGIYKKLTVAEFNLIISNLKNENLLEQVENTHQYIITNQGINMLEKFVLPIKVNGLLYEGYSDEFYQRLLLFIQVWTNRNQKSVDYIPVIDNYKVEHFIKRLYIKRKNQSQLDLKQLFDELSAIFKNLPDRQINYYIDRITGYNYYGLSMPQLAKKYETDKHTIHLSLVSTNHQILEHVLNNPTKYQILHLLMTNLLIEKNMTSSASETYKFFKEGYDLPSIARIRHLKLNTIYDHIVEISLYDHSFPLNNYVPILAQQEIVNYVRKHKTFKLKEIKDNISQEITYFEVRLVLSMMSSVEGG